ncbi:hypothetical protein [Protaetiibacter larvae]|uniref:Uncharacterized protein n=1 Tax=Protaetiibacter larvae TaxID=2592654 RepID=A0A5C1Y6K0_9MICO|nr:hypothetical protein [Protaetiibacter larvae]QEO08835.1 hypothetical protein FLP23_01665 [Protaetiibacter larvae]
MSRRHPALVLLPALLVMGVLSACAPTAPSSEGSGPDAGASSTTDDGATTDDGDERTSDDSFSGATIPGTGSYAIPDQIPFGGYQLEGDPGVLPDGCTWSITGDSGTVAENNGAYVFITDIPEASTFTTNGCPDWEQFE